MIKKTLMKDYKQYLVAMLLSLLFGGCAYADKIDKELEKQMADYWESRLQASPLLATEVGDTRFNDSLDDLSQQAFQQRIRDIDRAIKLLKRINSKRLSENNQINYKVFKWQLEHERERLNYPWHYITFNTFSGWHIDFANSTNLTPFNSEKDYRNHIERMSEFARYAEQNIELMKKGIEIGYVQACVSMKSYEDTISGYMTDTAQESVFYKPYKTIPKKYGPDLAAALQAHASKVIAASVLPAYKRYLQFFTQTYQPACRQSIGLSGLPKGSELYDYFVRYYTSVDTDAEAVHSLGLAEVKRIRGEMEKIIADIGFKGDLQSFFQHLKTSPQFYPEDEQSYLAKASTIAKRIDGKLPEFFSYLPRSSYGILPIDELVAPKMPTGYAQGGSADGVRAGQFRINTHRLESRPLYELASLTLHEGWPGHLMQGDIQREMDNLPDIRRYSGFNAYNEGWALYVERLGEEMGIYETAYDSFGRLGYEMWRACRLVVDSGIHSQGWTRQQAIDYMVANTALSLHNITTEVDRYIMWPGQALSYKYGELKIRELRARAENALGRAFSLRDFHTLILTSGALPLTVLDEVVERWINSSKP